MKSKKLKSIIAKSLATVIIGSTIIPTSLYAQENVDTETVDQDQYGKGFNIVEFSKHTGSQPTNIEINRGQGGSKEAINEVQVYKNLPQLVNGNYPEDADYGAKPEYLYDPDSYNGFDRQFAKKETIPNSIYFLFKGGFKGNNIYIPKDTYKNNQNMSIALTYPNSIYKTSMVKNEETDKYEKKQELCDAKITLDAFIYLNSPSNEYDGILFSTSNNFFSGVRPKNVESYRLTLELLDKSGKPIDVEEVKLGNGSTIKGNTYFTVGSMNAYEYSNDKVGNRWVGENNKNKPTRKFGEGVAMLNPAKGTKAITTKNTNVAPTQYKSQASDPAMKKRHPDAIINGLKWNFYYNDLDLDFFRGVRNDFVDTLGSLDFEKNAVSFELKQANSYQFLLGMQADRMVDGKTPEESNTYITDTGWNFFLSNPVFNTYSDQDAPRKTVSDDDEQDVVENWHNSATVPMTYRVDHQVKRMAGDTMKFYKSYSIKDSLPNEVEFVSARVLCDGKEFSKNVSYDKSSHKVSWNATKEDLGYFSYETATVNGKDVEYPVVHNGKMKMDGEKYSLEITVKIKKEALESGKSFKNKGDVEFDKITLSTNETITHPSIEDIPVISKDVEGKDKKVASVDEYNDFNLKVKLPKDANKYKNLVIKDKLDKRFDFTKNSIKASLKDKDGKKDDFDDIDPVYNKQDRTITVTVKDKKALKSMKSLNISFKAKLNDSTEPNAVVPNKATVKYSSNSGVDGQKKSNKVFVVSDNHTKPKVTKDVDGNTSGIYEVGEKFNFNVNVNLPKNIHNYEKMVIKDKLDKRLDVFKQDGKLQAKVLADNTKYENASISYDEKTREIKANIGDIPSLENAKKLTFNFKSMINSSAQKGEKIDNDATLEYKAPGGDLYKSESNKVHVDTSSEVNNPSNPKKYVEGKEHLETVIGKEFKYNVKVSLPANAHTYKKFEFIDKLDKRLDYTSNSAKVKMDGKVLEGFRIDYDKTSKTLKASISGESVESLKGGKQLVLSFKAKMNDKAENGADIPNTCDFNFINSSDFTETNKSNKVNVSAKDTNESLLLSKTINSDKETFDTKTNSIFDYNLKVKLPADIHTYKSLKVEDKLDERIDFVGLKSINVDGISVVADKEKPDGELDIFENKNKPIKFDEKTRTISLEIPSEKIKNLKGKKEIIITFEVKANKEDVKIPNIGNVISTTSKDKNTSIDSNRVEVNTKKDEGEEKEEDSEINPEKLVNGKKSVTATNKDELQFTLKSNLSKNIKDYKKLQITDKVDDRLEFKEESIRIKSNNKQLESKDFTLVVENNEIKVKIKNMDALENDISIDFLARIKGDVDNKESIKNNFNILWQDLNGSDESKDSNEVTVNIEIPNDKSEDTSEKPDPKNDSGDDGKGESDGKGEDKIKTGDDSNMKKIAIGLIVITGLSGGAYYVYRRRNA